MADTVSPPWLNALLLLCALLGCLANALVGLIIYKTKALRGVTHYLILNLAVSDGLCCLTFSLDVLMNLLGYPNAETSAAAEILYCRLFYGNYLFQSFAYASAFNLALVALERYAGIVRPLRYPQLCSQRRVTLAVLLAWTLGFGVYTVHLFGADYKRNGETVAARCLLVHAWWWHFVPLVGGFLAPLSAMIWAYACIIIALGRAADEPDLPGTRESLAAKRRMVHLMLFISVLYVVLYIPTQPVYMVIVNLTDSMHVISVKGLFLIRLFSKFPVLLNSLLNPFVYAFKYRKFQKGMREVLGLACRRSRVSPRRRQPVYISILARSQMQQQ